MKYMAVASNPYAIRQLTWIIACAGATLAACASPPFPPTDLRVNDAVSPVGIDAAPYFGWYVNDPDADEIQTAYQILVASSADTLSRDTGDIWDSGQVSSRMQNHLVYAGTPLESDQLCFWKVRTWDRDGAAGPYSEPARFVVGLLDNADWSDASWIKRDNTDTDDYTYFRKQTTLPDKTVERATVYISSVHKYALYVNGTLIGKGPAYHYPQYQYYNAYDITSQLQTNGPTLFAIFNHWFGGGQGRPASARGVIMKAIIHFSDGTSTVIGTDGTWRQSKAKAWDSNQPHRNKGEGVGYIEQIDARELAPDWNKPGFDDADWDVATVIGNQPVAPWTGTLSPDLTRIVEREITPVSVKHKRGGSYLVDLGKVYAGVPRIRFSRGQAGEKIAMLGGYALDSDDDIDAAMNQSTDMRYYAILDGGSFTYEPVEYLGMRYFEIEDSPMPVTKENFSFIERHSRMDDSASSFESSDPTLNAVWDLMKHSLYTCAQEEYVDTPTREKGGFLGDGAIQSTVAMPVMNERLLTRRVLHEFLQSMDQHWDGSGRMNAVYPNRDGARDIPDFTQAYLVWVWKYYMETGDRPFLAAYYDHFKAIADYVNRYSDADTGLITNLEGGSGAYQYGIVDWPAPMRYGYDMKPARTVINGWAYADYTVMADIAGVLGNTADEALYQQRADDLQEAINRRLLDQSGVYVDGLNSSHESQHANMFPLALGIVPDAQRNKVIEEIKGRKMSVGMVTLPWLIRAIGEADEGEHLIDLYTNEQWDGWAQCLAKGATATWESWNADATGQSMSHAWGASGLEGFIRYILGIRPLKPQYEEVLIKPLDFGSRLKQAKGTILTDRGAISVSWKSRPKQYMLRLDLPVNVTACVAVPKGTASTPAVLLDGNETEGTIEGNYILINNVGSGQHTIVRKLREGS